MMSKTSHGGEVACGRSNSGDVTLFGFQKGVTARLPPALCGGDGVCLRRATVRSPRSLPTAAVPVAAYDDYTTDGTLDNPVDWITGLHDVRLKDLPSFLRTTDPNDIMFDFMGEEAQNCLKAPAIIFNTFDDFEKEALEAVVSKFNFPNIYTIGPLPLLARRMPETEANTLSSVYGPDSSSTGSTGKSLLQSSKSQQPFLWIVRPDVVRGESAALPEEFLEESKARGLLVSWCAQDQVLAHKAVDELSLFVHEMGIGMEIDHDVKRDEVAELVKEMMEGEKGKKMRMKAQEWKRIAEADTDVGGMSYVNFDKFIKKGLHFED
ncbi:UNVERIFIED_CONTAM: Linamarin synthase 2 [Sesamum radiatum]|uniref:Linamarin synthase 2 n=1 Tax=Sesamum radiatum TaxID=300843 RepID=A0AAW2P2I6_SESRA